MRNKTILIDFAGTIAYTKLSFDEISKNFQEIIAKKLKLDIKDVKTAENKLNEI